MANEYLQRTPTSTGNQRVFTISVWIKRGASGGSYGIFGAGDGASATNTDAFWLSSDVLGFSAQDGTNYINASPLFRDISSWTHYHYIHKTDDAVAADRGQLFVNGVRLRDATSSTFSINQVISWMNKAGVGHAVGARNRAGYTTFMNGEMCDFFFIDGQALTPDVFGFYKQGKGYISVGSTQATDFRPGQWVPKTPRVIKTEINRRGGFGVNGFYLPMNDYRNFGADFHGEPNSIITLNEKLPQPRVGVASTAVVGLGYTDVLRADPYAANLVLAIPGVIGGQGSGYGDYSANIKGSGSNKTVTANGNAGVALTASYYGSALSFDGTGDDFYCTPSNFNDVDFGTGDFTVECWAYGNGSIVSGPGPTNGSFLFSIEPTDNSLRVGSTVIAWRQQSSASAIPVGQWNHVAFSRENGIGKLFCNGVCLSTTSNAFNYDLSPDNNYFVIGSRQENSGVESPGYTPFNGYIQDLRVYKGVAKYTGGFDVPRPYTPVGIATWRQVPDTTANNFATLNALQNSMTLTDGNLTCTSPGSDKEIYSTIGITTGKWYVEARTNTGTYNHFGLRANSNTTYDASYRLIARDDGNVYGDTSQGQVGTLSDNYNQAGDIVAMAIDGDNGQVTYYINGVNVGGPYSIYQYSSAPTPYKVYNLANSGDSLTLNFGQNPTFSGNTTAGTFTDSNGKGLFKYQPPSGFLALCEDNLPTPAISDPGKHFRSVLYRGSGGSRNLVGIGFTPDLIWIKGRDVQTNNHVLFDSVRGAVSGGYLMSAQTSAETPNSTMVLSFDNDGFSLGSDNTSAANNSSINYVAWCWRAGAGTTSTNTNGSITSVVSVNQDAGFSIVSWTGAGSGTSTVGHGLGKQPAFIITKARDSALDNNWVALHKSMGSSTFDKYMYLNTTAGAGALSPTWPATSTTFTTSPGFNSAARYISYCWAEIEGFSKFGSYIGNNSTDGPFVYCGFKPAWLMIKNTSAASQWRILDSSRDSVNPASRTLRGNDVNIEDSGIYNIDFLSNGFKLRATGTDITDSGNVYIFAAWAESPFTTANAK
jgi:hypothetical protein